MGAKNLSKILLYLHKPTDNVFYIKPSWPHIISVLVILDLAVCSKMLLYLYAYNMLFLIFKK